MIQALPTLVRRGFEARASIAGDDTKQQLPAWGMVLLMGTAVLFVVSMFTIDYTFGRLVPTLLIIESPPETIAFEPLPTDDPDSIIKDPEQARAKPQYITASFRRTLRHLGGFQARFRGFWMYFVTIIVVNFVGSTLNALPLLSFLPRQFWNAVATVICATLPLAWTHIVISQPSPKAWFRRLAPTKMWKKVAAPTAMLAVAEQLTVFLPLYLAQVSGVTDNTPEHLANMSAGQRTAMAFTSLGIFAFGLALSFLVVIPARATLVRVQGSLLPDSEDTIVPFDRSFNGKVVPEIVGGSGVISMLDAWKSFDYASRIRLVKAYLKVFAMQVGVTAVFFLCLVAEMFLIAGTNWSRLLPKDGDQQL